MRYETVTMYVAAKTEWELALHQGRMSSVPATEVIELGRLAFVGQDADNLADELAHLVDHAVSAALGCLPEGDEPTPVADARLGAVAAAALRDYAAACAEAVVNREAERAASTAGAPAGDGDGPALPAMRYANVWQEGRRYTPGECVTHGGALWHCGVTTSSKPGKSPDFQLMHKVAPDPRPHG